MRSLIDGSPQQTISVHSCLAQFGDGVFETCLVKNGVLLFWQYHFKRLSLGAKVINIDLPKEDIWLADIEKLLLKSKQKDGVIKLILSRSGLQRGYMSQTTKALRIVSIYPVPKAHRDLIILNICASGFSNNKALCGIKHCNRLDSILASSSIISGYDDCIMLDDKKRVISTTKANIFLVKNTQILTPKINYCGIEGTKKALIIELAKKLKLPLKQELITLKDLSQADEIFISNSIVGIATVKKILNVNFSPVSKLTITNQLKTALQLASKTHSSHIHFLTNFYS